MESKEQEDTSRKKDQEIKEEKEGENDLILNSKFII